MQFALERDRFRPNWRRGKCSPNDANRLIRQYTIKVGLVRMVVGIHTHSHTHEQVLWMRVWIAIRMDTPATVWSFQYRWSSSEWQQIQLNKADFSLTKTYTQQQRIHHRHRRRSARLPWGGDPSPGGPRPSTRCRWKQWYVNNKNFYSTDQQQQQDN